MLQKGLLQLDVQEFHQGCHQVLWIFERNTECMRSIAENKEAFTTNVTAVRVFESKFFRRHCRGSTMTERLSHLICGKSMAVVQRWYDPHELGR